MRYIRLCTVDDSFEAKFIKKALAEKGIPCIVTNENFTNLMPHINGMLGSGIQILVVKEDFELATQVIENRNRTQVTTCPNCGSSNIAFGLGSKKRVKRLLAVFISMLLAAPVRHVKQTYYCKDCKTEFGG